MTSGSARPALSVVLVTTAADRLRFDAAELAPFAMYQVVATGVMRSKPIANAAGIVAAWRAARVYAAARAAEWPAVPRMCYGASSPLLPFIRLSRLRRAWPRAVAPARWREAPALAHVTDADRRVVFSA